MVRFVVFGIAFAALLVAFAVGARADRYEDCEQLEDFDLAIRACTEIIGRGGKEKAAMVAQAYSNRGYAYAEKGQFDRAIADYNKSLARNPKDDNVYHYRGVAHMRKGRFDQALRDIGKALKMEPYNAFAYNDLALVYLKAGKAKRGLPMVNKAIKLDAEQAAFYETRGLIYEALGRKKEAISEFGSAVHLSPIKRYRAHLERYGL
jgi:tetratricopeptide (TPR) repeat protein